ncbi:MAG: 5-(carboxyamino)imidazole ribonucleotide mutase [Candidatus Omnitrophica bacterium]|nr:5-(carboxyamino)imidazole ribonucleotide mutase [Candidatus Omnitrophota bacterium]
MEQSSGRGARIGILMGSQSDWAKMEKAAEALKQFEVPCEMLVLSAHRLPDRVAEYARQAEARGLQILIAGAGMANHLAGALAANCTLPVIGVPLSGGALNGVDALYATVQMPKGVPVATVAIDGAANAAYLAVEIMALQDEPLRARLKALRQAERAKLEAALVEQTPHVQEVAR